MTTSSSSIPAAPPPCSPIAIFSIRSDPMLDAEARMLLDLMEKAVQEGRPKLHTLPYAVGRQAVDKMSEDSEADPMQVGETIDGDFAGPGGKIRFRRYRPQGAAAGPLPTLIYYHGGGFVIGNIETHDS